MDDTEFTPLNHDRVEPDRPYGTMLLRWVYEKGRWAQYNARTHQSVPWRSPGDGVTQKDAIRPFVSPGWTRSVFCVPLWIGGLQRDRFDVKVRVLCRCSNGLWDEVQGEDQISDNEGRLGVEVQVPNRTRLPTMKDVPPVVDSNGDPVASEPAQWRWHEFHKQNISRNGANRARVHVFMKSPLQFEPGDEISQGEAAVVNEANFNGGEADLPNVVAAGKDGFYEENTSPSMNIDDNEITYTILADDDDNDDVFTVSGFGHRLGHLRLAPDQDSNLDTEDYRMWVYPAARSINPDNYDTIYKVLCPYFQFRAVEVEVKL